MPATFDFRGHGNFRLSRNRGRESAPRLFGRVVSHAIHLASVDAASNRDHSPARFDRVVVCSIGSSPIQIIGLACLFRTRIVSGFEAESGSAAGNLTPVAMKIMKTDVDVHIWLLWQATLPQAKFDSTMGKLNH